MKRQIIAMGGGGFSMEPENPLLDQYILNASKLEKPKLSKPKVCFVPTASGDSAGYVERFYEAFKKLECEPSVLSLFNPNTWTDELEPFVAKQDVLYFGGGNTKNALVLWREWKLESLLRAAYERGAVLAGLSAGAICWFEQGSTDSIGRELGVLECLGWLKGAMTPHYDGEAQRRPKLHQFVLEGQIQNGFAADDGAALHFVNENLEGVVSSRPTARAYQVELQAGSVIEMPLETRYLGI
jgi:dipeptidase E